VRSILRVVRVASFSKSLENDFILGQVAQLVPTRTTDFRFEFRSVGRGATALEDLRDVRLCPQEFTGR